MHSTAPTALTFDETDDLLYFTRANEVQDLEQTITQLVQKYRSTPKDVLEAAVDPETGNTVLHFCSANGLVELLPVLLGKVDQTAADQTNGASHSKLVNHGNREGNTPIHWAAYNGHLAVVKLLVAAGADMWVKNAAGHLAMFEAERAEKDDVVQYLLEVGGKDVETGGSEGQASADDVADVQEDEPEGGASAQA
ncbi:hypothetical protein DOTSEDRAFT_97520, partial [Dothistroma septosporum NZE10]